MRYKWRPLQRCGVKPPSEQLIADYVVSMKIPREQVLEILAREEAATELWRNDIYQVQVRDLGEGWVHINVRRRDGAAILRDWRHFQRIKNEILGPECEAAELYPAESRLSDESNKYHLIGSRNPVYRFPFGDLFGGTRNVNYEEGNTPGTRQRSL
jgi:hypothetical protein